MELSTLNLRLVPFDDGHLADLHRLWTDPEVRRYLWDDRVISEQEAAEVIELSRRTFREDGFGMWSLFSHETGELVGFAGLRRFGEDGDVELLYGLLPSWWHRGLATEASSEVLTFAFERAGLSKVYAGADPPNQASFEVMKRLGFRFHDRRVIDDHEAVNIGPAHQRRAVMVGCFHVWREPAVQDRCGGPKSLNGGGRLGCQANLGSLSR